jgi:DUF1365 family protein
MTAVYDGWVRHRRFGDVEHAFRYPISMTYEDVAGDDVRDRIEAETGVRPRGPVRRLEVRRSLRVGFNPARFYYAWHEDRLLAVVAEVTNTPWGEQHAYVLDPAGGRTAKALHVSPFMPMTQEYAWRLTEPGEQLVVHLENLEEGHRVFDATLRLTRSARAADRFQPPRILARIYLQALRLKLKGAPYHAHPKAGP